MTAGLVERCERTDLYPDQCACPVHRNHDPMKRPAELPQSPREPREQLLGPWFQATHPGRCCRCQAAFRPFDDIRADWPPKSGWIARNCCAKARARAAA